MNIINLKNRKGALELSLTTIITIVLSVVFLILALIVLRNMYGFQTESIGAVQDKTLDEINKLYLSGEDPSTGIVFSLGSDKTASIRPGTEGFGVEIGSGTIGGGRIQSEDQIQFKLSLDESAPVNCIKTLGGKAQVVKLFETRLDTWLNMSRFQDSAGAMIAFITVPPGTARCTQVVKVQAKDYTSNPAGDLIAQESFTLKILRKSPFG